MKNKIIMTLLLLGLSPLFFLTAAPKIDIQDPALQKQLHDFLTADTEQARGSLRNFNDDQLLEIFSEYRSTKEVSEQRYLWLIEEYHAREADRIAQERLTYVALAIGLLMTGVFIFSLLTYLAQKKAVRPDGED